eukprot:CFRG4228T1
MNAPNIRTIAQTAEKISTCLGQFIKPSRLNRQKDVLATRNTVRVVLENITDPHNAAAVVRSAECLGVQDIHVIESTSMMRINDSVAANSSKWVTVHHHMSTQDCFDYLREKNYKIMASSLSETSKPIGEFDFSTEEDIALVFGNEARGISKSVAKLADEMYVLPMCGMTQSYNLSVSVAMSLYHLKLNGAMNKGLPIKRQAELHARWLIRDVVRAEAILKRFDIEIDE